MQQACHSQSVWLLHAYGSSTQCALQDVSKLRWHSLFWPVIALIDVAIGEVCPCDKWHPLWVTMQISRDEPFLPCSSLYCSSLWIGRSTNGLHPCCCHQGGRRFVSFYWIGSDLQHNVQYRQIPQHNLSTWGSFRLAPIEDSIQSLRWNFISDLATWN